MPTNLVKSHLKFKDIFCKFMIKYYVHRFYIVISPAVTNGFLRLETN